MLRASLLLSSVGERSDLAERKARNIPKASDESKKSVQNFEAFIRNWSEYSAVWSALGIQSPRIYPDAALEDFSSDHPVVQQRVYNFLCCVVGSDPQRLRNSLITDGYIPGNRALLFRKEWTQLNYGWWTVLEPHLTDSCKKETAAARQQVRKDLEDENKAMPAIIRQIRGGQ